MLARISPFFLVGILAPLVSSGATAAEKASVAISDDGSNLRVEIHGKLFTEYHYKGVSRPFLYPVLGPDSLPMTRNWPMAQAENEEHDHPHHKSLFFAHGSINGNDFWSEEKGAGKTVHDKFVAVKSGKVGVIHSANRLVSNDGQLVATEEEVITIYPETNGTLFDFDVTTYASEGDLVFGDTKEGTMAVRLAETMRLKGKVGQGHIVNSEGVRDGDTWGKRAKWCDYYGPVEGKTVGIAIFENPANFRHPTWWHVRDYGLFAANPFGIHDFEKKEKGAGDFKLPKGGHLTLRYRFLLHRGDEKEGRVAEHWEEYVRAKNK